MNSYRYIFILLLAISGVFCLNATDVEVSDTLHEITVSSIKQTMDMSKSPASLTVLNASHIEKLNVDAVKNVSAIAPNFFIPDYGSRMTSSIYVRGLGARIDQPVVGLNVDNVPILNKDNYDFELADVERIEVLRGPQSTLFGRNTMGGLINIYTMSPMKYQGVRFMGEYGSGNSLKASLSYYTKINRRLAMSIGGNFTMTDGYYKNNHNGADVGTERQGALRWKTKWYPSSTVSVENVATAQFSKQSGYPYQSVASGEINYNDTCFYRRTSVTDGLTVNWNKGTVSFSSITGFQYLKDNMTLDQDFLPLEYFTLTQKRHEWALTQDFILKGNENDYDWLFGAFGFYRYTNMSAPVTFKDYGIEQLIEKNRNEQNPDYPIGWNEDCFILGSDFVIPTYGLALYHQSHYDLNRWSFTLGLRLDYEKSSLDYNSHCNTSYNVYDNRAGEMSLYGFNPVEIDDYGHLNQSFLEFLPKLTVAYRLLGNAESRIYASIAKGYKAGGFNTQMFSDVLQQRIRGMMGLSELYNVDDVVSYKPEKSWNYELGAHIIGCDGRYSLGLSTFYIDCRDQQLTMFPDGTTTGRIMTNAGKTRSCGVELSASWNPARQWSFNVSYGLTDARFEKFDNGKEDYSGKYIPYAPKNTLFVGASYRLNVNNSWLDQIAFDVNVKGVGDIYWDEANSVKQPFYALLGTSVRFEKDNFSLNVWGDNLTDTHYNTFYFVSIGNAFLQQGNPARCGVTLKMNFNTNK
ncbi:MAG: TonB-dependent receptor [Bacteroidales bacterium]|nr:TonB-dependent receptor [Bacteroidales bacterium]